MIAAIITIFIFIAYWILFELISSYVPREEENNDFEKWDNRSAEPTNEIKIPEEFKKKVL